MMFSLSALLTVGRYCGTVTVTGLALDASLVLHDPFGLDSLRAATRVDGPEIRVTRPVMEGGQTGSQDRLIRMQPLVINVWQCSS
jgi:hypothetical protein